MFSATAIGLIVAASTATWVYAKTMRQTGNNNRSSAIMAVLAGIAAFVVIVTIVWTIDKMLGN